MSTRRGGLGRGLGALIQSTVDPIFDSNETAASRTPQEQLPAAGGKAAEDKAASPGAAGGTPAPRRAAKTGDADKKNGASKDKKAGASAQKADASEAASPKASATTAPAKKQPAARKTASSRGRDARAERPVDVFFSSPAAAQDDVDTADAKGEGAPSTGKRSARGPRQARPPMPLVKAPAKQPHEVEQDGPSTDQDGAEATQDGGVPRSIAELREIPVEQIQPNPRQPREVFDEEHMAELVASIQQVGILQPVVVREVSGPVPYELIMGERRWRATQLAGLETIPAIVRQTSDENLLRDALLENLHRSQLNPLEEAAAYQQLMEDFACTQEELSQRIGRSRPQISNTLRLLKLPPLVQRRLAAGTLSAGHARALLGLTDPAEMERLAQRIVSEGLSVRATEDAVAQLQGTVRPAPKARRTPGDPSRHERLDYFATALTSRLDTPVKITLGARKGRIAIDFTSVEDLNRIMDLIQGEQQKKR